jgi:beta-lactamase class D
MLRPGGLLACTVLFALGCGRGGGAGRGGGGAVPDPDPGGAGDSGGGGAVPDPDPGGAGGGGGLPAIDWARHGLADGGCFVVLDLDSGQQRISDAARCARPRRPYSTFKIPAALIGLDTGLLAGPDAPLPYDRATYPPEAHWPADWRQDLPLRRAIAISAVPLFRGLATRIGAERMRGYLDRLAYGNRDPGGPDQLDHFWLRGPLRIAAPQQVALLAALVRDELAVSAEAQAATRAILLREERGDVRLFHKTGSGRVEEGDDGSFLGWLVGWIEQGRQIRVFALWVEDPAGYAAMDRRRARTFEGLLGDLGVPAP